MRATTLSINKRPTIFIIGPTPPPYHGVSVATQLLLDYLPTRQFSVNHVDTADRRGIAHVDQPDLWDGFLFVRQWIRHITAILQNRPHVCYLPLSQSRIGFVRDSLFMLPALLCNTAVVVHLHGANFEHVYRTGGSLFQRYADWVLRRVSKFIVLGDMLRPIFQRWTEPSTVAVVPNGVVEMLPHPLEGESHRRASTFRIVFLSTLSQGKGLFVLLDALALVAKKQDDFECHIAGPWWGVGTEETARARVSALGLEPRATFHGILTGCDKARFLKSGDVFVFPGIQQEGQPLTVLEAMCAGLPVIATDRGCLRETVVEGVTGFIVQPHSPEAIADRILKLIREPHTRKRMGTNARRRYEQEYTMSAFASRMADLLAEVSQLDYRKNPKSMDSHHWSAR